MSIELDFRDFIEEISKQRPEKPDYWSSCGQCDRNIDRAQELLELPKPIAEQVKNAERWERLMWAMDYEFPLLSMVEDPENEPKMIYGSAKLTELVDGFDYRCDNAPTGWQCGRKPGHDGPCAAYKDTK